jgi:hypothetical protein
MKRIHTFESFLNEANTDKTVMFQDIKIGDMFLRFGADGQLWKKNSNTQAEFIDNVGKKTAKYDKKPGSINVFPKTMDVTPYQK